MSVPQIAQEPFEVRNGSGDLIRGDLRYVNDGIKKPVIVICHSFMAFKEWGFFPYVAQKFAEAGFVTATFNFSHNGVVGDNNRITDFVNFQKNSISQELEDLRAVIEYLSNGSNAGRNFQQNDFCLVGHSRGGGVAIIYAASDKRITSIVTWSAVATFDRWTQHQKELWRTSGYLPLAKDTTVSPLRLGIELLNDVERHRGALDILQSASKISVPWLIVHGKADVTVRLREAEKLYEVSDKQQTEFIFLDGVGHLYNAATYTEDNYKILDRIIYSTTNWINSHLKKEK